MLCGENSVWLRLPGEMEEEYRVLIIESDTRIYEKYFPLSIFSSCRAEYQGGDWIPPVVTGGYSHYALSELQTAGFKISLD